MVVIVPPDILLQRGLQLVGFSLTKQAKKSIKARRLYFRAYFGSNPEVCTNIFDDLQTTGIEDAKVEPQKVSVKYFLMSLHFLRCNPTEIEQSGFFKVSEKTARNWTWYYVAKIAALKGQKVVWPDLFEEVFILSVDGTHCPIEEPKHPTLSKDPSYYSHKTNGPALNYEIGLSVFHSQLLWVNGPFPAGIPDITVFRSENGLKDMIPPGKLVIGDMGYRGEGTTISIRSSFDTPQVKRFKKRARSRHETFNNRLKKFRCLKDVFRHYKDKHKIAFESICVIVQYQMDNGSPLFDV